MALDSKRIADRMKEKAGGGAAAESGEAEPAKSGRPGAMLRRALKAENDDAIEEAIRQCVEGGYEAE